MTWTPPATISLSSNDITHVMDGLRGDDRDVALQFVDTVTDRGLLYVIASELVYLSGRNSRSRPAADAPTHELRDFIRNY